MNVRITKIKPGAAFKLVAGSATCFSFALCLFFGVLAVGGCNTVRWNNQPVTGLWALPYAMLISIMMSIGTTLLGWIGLVIGSAIFRRIYPTDFECEVSEEGWPNQPPNTTSQGGSS